MLSASPELTRTIERGDALTAKVKVIAEWNHNRYTPITTVDNFGYPEATNAWDLDLYPIKSITEPVRPKAGVAFAKAGEATVAGGYDSSPATKRYYVADEDSKYKYWTSPTQSLAVKNALGTYNIANTQPYIVYSKSAWSNKIYLCVENAWAYPANYTVQITTDGTTWTTVYTGTSVEADGSLSLYRQANGTWTKTVDYTNPIQIRGVRLNVTAMNIGGSFLNLIELGARLESDLSEYVVEYDVSNEMGDVDFVTPVGTASSNGGSISFSNYDGRFNNDDPDTIYKGLIDANVKFTIELGIDTTAQGGVGVEWVRQATMYADGWNHDIEAASVSLKDASKFLQEVKPLAMLMEKVTIGKAIWQILDSVGFTSYAYSQRADSSANVIDYFWTDPDKTVWEIIQQLCRVTQSAAFFDQYGVLQIQTRDAVFNKTKPQSWTLDYAQNGLKLPDIQELSVEGSFEANKVIVNYRPTALSIDAQKRPVSEIVWEPDEDVVLRSTALWGDMSATQMTMGIDPKDAPYWPYEGLANIRGEIVRFKGKNYRYINKSGVYAWANVKSHEEKLNVDNNLTKDGEQYRSAFTGTIFLTERGVDTSTAKAHDTTIAGWINGAYWGTGVSAMARWNGGLKHIPQDGILRLQTNKGFTGNHWYVASRGNVTYATPNYYFGTRFRFPSSPAGAHRQAGIFFAASGDLRTMYCLDIMTTKAVGPYRSYRNEIAVIRRDAPGKNTYLGKGAVAAIGDNIWYDIDIQNHGGIISVRLNGRTVLNVTDPKKDIPNSSRQGLFVRGFTVADFEYYYHASYTGGIEQSELDNSSFLDIRKGGFHSSQYYRDYLYYEKAAQRRIGNKTVTVKERHSQRLFDEFGMNIHEMREYDIKFERPAIYSSLYVSNQDQSVVTEYVGNPFGAKFIVANAARQNAVLKGDDTTLGADNVVQQKMMVTARTVKQEEVKTYEVTDKQAITARGEIALTFDSEWIQSEAQAKALGDWIVLNWAKPAENVEVEVFGNPLFQIGDIVAVNYPPNDMTAQTHKYFVTAVGQTWSEGPSTRLTLRRAHI